MNVKKDEKDKKVKFGICVDPLVFKKMDESMVNKSKLINTLLKEYYGKKSM